DPVPLLVLQPGLLRARAARRRGTDVQLSAAAARPEEERRGLPGEDGPGLVHRDHGLRGRRRFTGSGPRRSDRQSTAAAGDQNAEVDLKSAPHAGVSAVAVVAEAQTGIMDDGDRAVKRGRGPGWGADVSATGQRLRRRWSG